MTQTAFDFLVYIGRFQPFHNGHLATVTAGLMQAEQMIILCGSACQPRSVRNPWTDAERINMMEGSIPDADKSRVHVAAVMDSPYDQQSWISNIQATVNDIVQKNHSRSDSPPKIGLINCCHKNPDFLSQFPQWDLVTMDAQKGASSSDIRNAIFGDQCEVYLGSQEAKQALSANTLAHIAAFTTNSGYADVKAEYQFIADHKLAWSVAPYPPVFVTVDTVVIQNDYLLMVERKGHPGKGLMALPGGFLDQQETLVEGCIRELKEETCLAIPDDVLIGAIKKQDVFDAPYRSARGRTITHGFYLELEPNEVLPEVKGSDDAERAIWVPLADLNPKQVFEDHYFIIQKMIGK